MEEQCSLEYFANIPSMNSKRKREMETETNNEERNKRPLNRNYYAVLEKEMDQDVDQTELNKFQKHVKKSSDIAPKETQNMGKTIRNDDLQKSMAEKRTQITTKVPPINVYEISTKQLIDFIKNGLKIQDFKIKEMKGKKTIYMSNLENYLKVRKYLEKSETKFFTYTPKELKTRTFLLKGLESDISTQEIIEELYSRENEHLQFIKVTPFATKNSIKQNYKLPIYMVQITADSKINELKKIKTLMYRCIKWETIKQPDIPQCRNCQGFFHSAANCFLAPKCVKCGKSHDKGKCDIKENENNKEKMFCVLCNKFGHPSSYKGCEVYKKLQKNLRDKKMALRKNKDTETFSNTIYMASKKVSNDMNYADVLKSKSQESNNSQFFIELKQLMSNMNQQILNLQNQLKMQVSRIDAIFSIIGV